MMKIIDVILEIVIGILTLFFAAIGLTDIKVDSDLIIIFVILYLIVFAYQLIKKYLFKEHFYTKPDIEPLHIEADYIKYASKGLILLISRYTNISKPKPKELEEPNSWLEYAKNEDWKTLQLYDKEATNIGPAIEAIKVNKSKLKHIWFVCTEDGICINSKTGKQETNIGSVHIIPALVSYLKNKLFKEDGFNSDIQIHPHENYLISLDAHEQICKKIYVKIKDIFDEARDNKDINLREKDIKVDVTGGPGLLTIGSILACSAKDQIVEYMSNPGANIVGDIKPVVISFDIQSNKNDA